MALRRAASQLHRSLAPYATARALAGAHRAVSGSIVSPYHLDIKPTSFLLHLSQVGTSFPTKANESTIADNEPFAEPETVGWGATTVGKLLESKVGVYGSKT
jgi:hypothetical protein